MRSLLSSILLGLFLFGFGLPIFADEIADDLKTISLAGSDDQSPKQIRTARDRLANQGVQILPRLLISMDQANSVAINWHRTIFEKIVDRELKRQPHKLPMAFLKKYVREPQHAGIVRRRVLALIDQIEPGFSAKLIPSLLNDSEFRDDAVSAIVKTGDQAKKAKQIPQALAAYQKAFEHARESSQILLVAERLKSVGEDVDIIRQMGFITNWYLLGPFDAPGMSGFEMVFPPEKSVDLKAKYTGKSGTEISWERFQTDDRLGQTNLIQAIASVKEAAGFAYTEIVLQKGQKAELRCGADDNITVWLNEKKVFTRLQWLNGTRLDRFTAPLDLKAGRNTLLVKICQGPQHKNPAVPNNWSFQIRVCDKTGAGIRFQPGLKKSVELSTQSSSK